MATLTIRGSTRRRMPDFACRQRAMAGQWRPKCGRFSRSDWRRAPTSEASGPKSTSASQLSANWKFLIAAANGLVRRCLILDRRRHQRDLRTHPADARASSGLVA